MCVCISHHQELADQKAIGICLSLHAQHWNHRWVWGLELMSLCLQGKHLTSSAVSAQDGHFQWQSYCWVLTLLLCLFSTKSKSWSWSRLCRVQTYDPCLKVKGAVYLPACSRTYRELSTQFFVQFAAMRRWVRVAGLSWEWFAWSPQIPGWLPMCFGDCTVGFGHLGLLDCDFSLYRIQPPEIANITIHITALNILVNISGKAIPQALLSQACVLAYNHGSVSSVPS